MKFFVKLLFIASACVVLLIAQLDFVGAGLELQAVSRAEMKHAAAFTKWEREHPDENEREDILIRATTTPTTLPFRYGVSGPQS